jgi:hypothetical protein
MFLKSRARPVCEINLTTICEPFLYTVWDPQYFTNLLVSTACYGDGFTPLYVDDVRTSLEAHALRPVTVIPFFFSLTHIYSI